jgi:hypothetical protein
MSFYLSNKEKTTVSYDISLDIDYNYKPSIASSVMLRFSPAKLFSYKKGANLNIKYSQITEIFYRRCINGSLYHTYLPETPKEGKLYKIKPASSTDLVW